MELPFDARAVTLADGTMLIAGQTRGSGSGALSLRASCAGVDPLDDLGATYLPIRSGRRKAALDRRQFCAMAFEAREYYKRATMERGPLAITIDADRNKATVRAHYTVKEPVYAYADSPHSHRDRTEVQTATRQTETDDESVVIVEDGELKFASTSSVSKSFLIAKQRDRRL
jgi:hypothetical protein